MRRVFSPAVLLATAAYVVLTVALTWPLILHPGSRVPNDLGDSLLNTWLMGWNARVLPLTAKWWNAPQFFPVGGAMAFSEHLLGLSWITTPVMWLSGNPLLAYNAAFFFSFPLCALSAYFLTYSISRRHDCAFVSGLAFGFAPYRMAQFAHLQVLSAYWMPLALAGLHRYFEDGRGRWLMLFAAAWLMQALACGYYLFYLSVLIGLWLLWFGAGRERWRALPRVVLAWAVAALMLAPVLYGYWTYQHAYGMRRWPDEIAAFSADVASVLKAPFNLRLWGWLDVVDRPESSLFPGVTTVLLIVAGLAIGWSRAAKAGIGRLRIARALVIAGVVVGAVAASPLYFGPWKIEIGGLRLLSVSMPHKPLSIALLLLATAGGLHPSVRTAWRHRSALAFYALAAIVMWLFSLGPAPTLMNTPIIYKAPYAWLMMLPGAEGVRVPARFWMLAVLCLAVAAGLALRQIGARWPRLAPALPVLACIGLLSDAWPVPIALELPPQARPIHTRAVARLELPVSPAHDLLVLYRATAHRRPVINGYSGYFAPHYWALQYLLDRRDPDVLTRLSALGSLEVVIDHGLDRSGALRRFVRSHPQAEHVYEDAAYTTYRIQGGPQVQPLAKVEGDPLPIASIAAADNSALVGAMTDRDIVTRWHAGREQRPGDTITVDLGQPRLAHGAETLIAGYVADFPRRLSIDTSLDGHLWSPAWSGETALMALSAALEDPLNVRLPFSFEPRAARYLRFTQTGSERTYYWSIAELRILGR
jgi:hypothetical protein